MIVKYFFSIIIILIVITYIYDNRINKLKKKKNKIKKVKFNLNNNIIYNIPSKNENYYLKNKPKIANKSRIVNKSKILTYKDTNQVHNSSKSNTNNYLNIEQLNENNLSYPFTQHKTSTLQREVERLTEALTLEPNKKQICSVKKEAKLTSSKVDPHKKQIYPVKKEIRKMTEHSKVDPDKKQIYSVKNDVRKMTEHHKVDQHNKYDNFLINNDDNYENESWFENDYNKKDNLNKYNKIDSYLGRTDSGYIKRDNNFYNFNDGNCLDNEINYKKNNNLCYIDDKKKNGYSDFNYEIMNKLDYIKNAKNMNINNLDINLHNFDIEKNTVLTDDDSNGKIDNNLKCDNENNYNNFSSNVYNPQRELVNRLYKQEENCLNKKESWQFSDNINGLINQSSKDVLLDPDNINLENKKYIGKSISEIYNELTNEPFRDITNNFSDKFINYGSDNKTNLDKLNTCDNIEI